MFSSFKSRWTISFKWQYSTASTTYLNINLISLRLFNVYGPRSRTSGAYGAVFGVFLAQKLANKPLTIVGSGKQTRDFIHISDIVEALYKAAFSKFKGKVYNVGGGKEISVNQIANLISKKRLAYIFCILQHIHKLFI